MVLELDTSGQGYKTTFTLPSLPSLPSFAFIANHENAEDHQIQIQNQRGAYCEQ